MNRLICYLFLIPLLFSCQQKKKTTTVQREKPAVFIIGDSTVKHGHGDGAGGHWGWGDPIQQYFDSSKIIVENHALGGTSSRTYRTKGLWTKVVNQLQPGDFVLMQFGHNDNGPLNDDFRARGTIKGTGDESQEINNRLTGKHETVHSYGWYIRQYIRETKAKGATPIVIAPIPRNLWKNGKMLPNNTDYTSWARQVAQQEKVPFINLNQKMATVLAPPGQDSVTGTYFLASDHTHTTAKGALLAASKVVEGLKELSECPLKNDLLAHPVIHFPVKKNVWIIGDSTVAKGDGTIVGWGYMLPSFLDTSRVAIHNKARGGRSSRSYRYEGLWKDVLSQLHSGDFLLIQFGHNDGGPIDQPKFRGSIQGMSDSTRTIVRPGGNREVVHTYGWYMKSYIREAKVKGVKVVVLSMIPRKIWKDGKIIRADQDYGKWAREAAQQENAYFIDLNNAIALEYEAMGQNRVNHFFPKDHTHTNADGARFNAFTLAQQIKLQRNCPLSSYVLLEGRFN